MRIALIDPSLFTLPYDAALASGLRQVGHEVRLYGRSPGTDDNNIAEVPLVPAFYRLTSRPIVLSFPNAVRLAAKGAEHIWSMTALRRQLAQFRPDVIHFQWMPLPVVDRFFLPGLKQIAPLVLTVHDTNPFNGAPAARLQALGVPRGLAGFDRLIVHTEQGRQRLLTQGAAAALISIVPHGLLGGGPAKAPADSMGGTLRFLLFGKIKPYKGLDLLLEAFARLPEELQSQAEVLVVGKPYIDLAPFQALAAKLGVTARLKLDTRFVSDEEVPELFGPGTIAMFPYREIDASGVLSLAVAFGRPVIATRIGSFGETIEHEKQGLLVPPNDPAALAAAMARMIADREFAASCARQMQHLAGAAPGWDEIARRTVAVYSSIAGSAHAA
ncbi:MAG: glycosyltransferase [Acetobacteraceae bacterium]|nr:glycosyltransferase [Acetobacteraceae bacterium]